MKYHLLASLCTALAAISPVLVQAQETFNPPELRPFLQLALLVDYPVNTTTLWGDSATFANRGGNVTGAIEGTVVPVGAAYEWFAPGTNNTISFYENAFYLNTTAESVVIRGEARGTVHYANNALHGFGSFSFVTSADEYVHLSYGSYVTEWSANFNTGEAVVDVFEIVSTGRVDGEPVPALLPPGESAASES